MKNYIVLEQDDAFFSIENPRTEAQIIAAEIISYYNQHKEETRKAARKAHPVRVSFSARCLVGDVEKYNAAIEKGMQGFSYTSDGAKEIRETPKGTLVVEFVGCVAPYQNKFSFEII